MLNSINKNKQSFHHAPFITKVTKKFFWPTRIISLVFGGFFFIKFFQAYLIGAILINTQYYLNDTAVYWLVTIGYLVLALGHLWQMVRVKIKT